MSVKELTTTISKVEFIAILPQCYLYVLTEFHNVADISSLGYFFFKVTKVAFYVGPFFYVYFTQR